MATIIVLQGYLRLDATTRATSAVRRFKGQWKRALPIGRSLATTRQLQTLPFHRLPSNASSAAAHHAVNAGSSSRPEATRYLIRHQRVRHTQCTIFKLRHAGPFLPIVPLVGGAFKPHRSLYRLGPLNGPLIALCEKSCADGTDNGSVVGKDATPPVRRLI